MRSGTPHGLVLATVAIAGVTVACDREPREAICPTLGPGDLVVTEIRGDQSGSDDTLGEWIELYNASGADIDLTGVVVRVTRLDGGALGRLVFRRAVTVAADDYVVLGRFFDFPDSLPTYVQYGYADTFDTAIYDTGAIEIFACGTETDQLVYRNLPSTGTYSFDGALDPSAEANDDDSAWCTDDLSGDPEATGTPGQRNAPCP